MLNNKGFAISTMLYGLLIVIVLIVSLLMSTISFTRKTSKEFSETIVDQLEARTSFTVDNSSIFNDYRASCATTADSKVSTCESGGSTCNTIRTYEIKNCCLEKCDSDENNCYKVCTTP